MKILSFVLFAITKIKMNAVHASLTILRARSRARAQWAALLNSLQVTALMKPKNKIRQNSSYGVKELNRRDESARKSV